MRRGAALYWLLMLASSTALSCAGKEVSCLRRDVSEKEKHWGKRAFHDFSEAETLRKTARILVIFVFRDKTGTIFSSQDYYFFFLRSLSLLFHRHCKNIILPSKVNHQNVYEPVLRSPRRALLENNKKKNNGEIDGAKAKRNKKTCVAIKGCKEIYPHDILCNNVCDGTPCRRRKEQKNQKLNHHPGRVSELNACLIFPLEKIVGAVEIESCEASGSDCLVPEQERFLHRRRSQSHSSSDPKTKNLAKVPSPVSGRLPPPDLREPCEPRPPESRRGEGEGEEDEEDEEDEEGEEGEEGEDEEDNEEEDEEDDEGHRRRHWRCGGCGSG